MTVDKLFKPKAIFYCTKLFSNLLSLSHSNLRWYHLSNSSLVYIILFIIQVILITNLSLSIPSKCPKHCSLLAVYCCFYLWLTLKFVRFVVHRFFSYSFPPLFSFQLFSGMFLFSHFWEFSSSPSSIYFLLSLGTVLYNQNFALFSLAV